MLFQMKSKAALSLATCLAAFSFSTGPVHAKEPMLIGTLKKVKDTGVLVVGYRESSVPFSYMDSEKKPMGYAVELCNHIVEAVRTRISMPAMQVLMQPVTSANRMEYLDNGLIDLECGSTTNSVERQRKVDFGYTTFLSNIRVLVRKNSGILAMKDLKGKRVVTTAGATSDVVFNRHNSVRGLGIKMAYGVDHQDSFQQLLDGKADAFVLDDILLTALVANSKRADEFHMLPDALRTEPYGIMVRKYDDQFKQVVDDTLFGLMRSGQIKQIYAKWFQQPIPHYNINLQYPLSAQLSSAFKKPNSNGVE